MDSWNLCWIAYPSWARFVKQSFFSFRSWRV